MSGPMHGHFTRISYLILAGLLFAVALWMYNCVLGFDETPFTNVKVVAQTMIPPNDFHKDFRS